MGTAEAQLARDSGMSREALARFVLSAQRFGSLDRQGVVRVLRDPKQIPYIPVAATSGVRLGPISSPEAPTGAYVRAATIPTRVTWRGTAHEDHG